MRNDTRTRLVGVLLVGALTLCFPVAMRAQAPAPRAPQDLTAFTIEDLMNITITSASRKQERADEVAAAVFVITADDIRRSGMATLPDLLRMVPGVQVAQINANKWAVSVRGFNGIYANKLLVLVDGRSVYNHLFSGVMWDMEDLLVEDIARIEVIRGPGAAVWGANAVNGVINILTKTAAETSGTLVRAGAGSVDPGQLAFRYGGALGNTAYRVDAQWSGYGDSKLASGTSAGDRWNRSTVGFRGDWTGTLKAFTLQGRMISGTGNALWLDFNPSRASDAPLSVQRSSDIYGGVLVGRWSQTRDNGASFQVQSVLDVAQRHEPVGAYRRRTADVDFQYHTKVGARNDLVAGAGYRRMHEQFAGRNGYTLTPEISDDDLINVFAQDEITLAGDRLHLTLGAKLERESQSGWGLQPNARATWVLVPHRQYVWAASSRALRTPALTDRGIRVEFPPLLGAAPLPIRITAVGTPDRPSEVLTDVEAGYRVEIASVATVGVTGFHGRYKNLATAEPLDPVLTMSPEGPYLAVLAPAGSLMRAKTRGLEIDGHWTPVPRWRLDASFTTFRFTPRLDPASRDREAAVYDADASSAQWHLHSGWTLGQRGEVDLSLFRVGALKRLAVPAYTRLDARVAVPAGSRVTVSLIGQNLLDDRHVEFGHLKPTITQTMARRSARLQVAWRY